MDDEVALYRVVTDWGRRHSRCRCCYAVHGETHDVDCLVAEIERLRRWKSEAIEVLGQWHDVADMVPQRPEHLGRPQSEMVADYIAELEAGALDRGDL